MEHSDIVPPPRRCRLVAKSLSKVALRLPDYEPVNHCPGTGHERRRIPSSKSGLIACPAARSAKGSQPSFPWIAEQRPVFAPFQWSWNSAFQEVRRATPDSHKGDDVLSIGMSRLSLLTIPRTLYYCLGNTSELRIDPIGPARLYRGNVPFASGLVHSLGNFSELVIPQARVQKHTPETPDDHEDCFPHSLCFHSVGYTCPGNCDGQQSN